MLPQWAEQLFETQHGWLSQQPNMQNWQVGCEQLFQQLSDWVQQYTAQFCDRLPLQPDKLVEYATSAWETWLCHWMVASKKSRAICGHEVARSIVAGRGFAGAGNLGGNVIHDKLLARALLNRQEKAILYFEEHFAGYVRRLSGRRHSRWYHTFDQWWSDFVEELIGCGDHKAKLGSFRGKSGLLRWLPPVVWSYLCQKGRQQLISRQPNVNSKPEEPLAPPASADECCDCVRTTFQQELANLPPESRLVIKIKFVPRNEKRLMKAVLNRMEGQSLSDSQITRRRCNAMNELRIRIRQAMLAKCPQCPWVPLSAEH